MPATKANFVVLFEGDSQIYTSGSKEVAMKTPPPEGMTLEQKRVFFITHQPDNKIVSMHEVPHEEVLSAEIEYPKSRKKKIDEQATE